MDAMFTEIGPPGAHGRPAPPLNDAGIAAMGADGTEYHCTFD
jgi:hypothetical protein